MILREGHLLAWIGRTEKSLITFLPESEPDRGHAMRAIARALAELVDRGRRKAVMIATVDGDPTGRSVLRPALEEAGFTPSLHGHLRRARPGAPVTVRADAPVELEEAEAGDDVDDEDDD